jgi:ATPase subunit of ABC transporter with duplicated ATPase domains
LEEIEHILHENSGYSAESDAAALLEGLGLPAAIHRNPMSTLSGGYRLRVLLAQTLFSKPDALFLDEPTNHLDLPSIKWLEETLQKFPGILLLSSHDRTFINKVCDHILDVDHRTIKLYKGNFDAYEETKAEELAFRAQSMEKQERRKEELQGFVDRFRAKASKARQAQSKMRFIEKLEEEMTSLHMQPSSRQFPHIDFRQCRPSGAIVLKTKNISKAFGPKQVLHNISFEVEKGDKVAFVGANGIGKSTLLEILTGNLQPDAGSFEWGHATFPVYFPQNHAKLLGDDITVLEWMEGLSTSQTQEQLLRDVLAKVLFHGDDVKKKLKVLSGGEAARLLLAKMILLDNNVLLFDEPTNHLDMESTEALMEALQEYHGTVLFVSHNRYFIEGIATRIIEMTPQGIRDFRGTYPEFVEKTSQDYLTIAKAAKKVENKPVESSYESQKKQQRQKEQAARRAQKAEELCHELEGKIAAIDARMGDPSFYASTTRDEQTRLLAEKSELETKLAAAYESWEQNLL